MSGKRLLIIRLGLAYLVAGFWVTTDSSSRLALAFGRTRNTDPAGALCTRLARLLHSGFLTPALVRHTRQNHQQASAPR